MALKDSGSRSQKCSWDWDNEIVLVTGGSSGIGELVARKLAQKNVKVIVLDLRPPQDYFPAIVRFYQVDVTSPEAIRQAAESIRQDVGAPTVLINNAGVASLKTILEESEQQIRGTFNVNILAHFFLVKEFLPSMVSQDHGHIVTVASMASFVTLASNVDYSCTKAAALSFHEGLTQELKYKYNTRNVCTSVIHPTWVRTPMMEAVLDRGGFKGTVIDAESVADAIVRHVLKGKSGQLFLPKRYGIASGIRGFPTWLQEIIRGSRHSLLSS